MVHCVERCLGLCSLKTFSDRVDQCLDADVAKCAKFILAFAFRRLLGSVSTSGLDLTSPIVSQSVSTFSSFGDLATEVFSALPFTLPSVSP